MRRDLRGALLYHDAMEDDARFTLAVVRTAIAARRVRPSPSRVSGPWGLCEDGDRVTGATRRGPADRGHRSTSGPPPSSTPPASGARCRTARSAPARFDVLPARGSHLVIERDRIPARGGMTLRIPGRVAFLVPWPRHWIIGTTDKPLPRAAGPRRRQRRGGGRDPRDAERGPRPGPSPATTSSAPTPGSGRWSRRRTRHRPSGSPASTGWRWRRRVSSG